MDIKWYNSTPDPIVVMEADEDGEITGILNGIILNFKVVKKIEPDRNNCARLISCYQYPPQTKVVDGINLIEHQDWNRLNFNSLFLPGKSCPDHNPKIDADIVYVIFSLPVAEFLVRWRSLGITVTRMTPTIICAPNTSPECCVRDPNGAIIGVTSLKGFGNFPVL